MATQHSLPVLIKNDSGGNAWILLFHRNDTNGTQCGSWQATWPMSMLASGSTVFT